jgi:PEP-CTERM motif
MSTAAGDLTLVYNAAAGVSSSITNSITAVPEPSSLHLAVVGGLAGVGIALIRRRRAVAVA